MPTWWRRFNPLRRVPTLVLDDGEALIESTAILDHLDEARRPRAGADRRARAGAAARSQGLRPCDRPRRQGGQPVLRAGVPPADLAGWIDRCRGADRRRAGRPGAGPRRPRPAPTGSAPSIGHADIAVACALRFRARPMRACSMPSATRAGRACRPMRGAAGVPGDRAALSAAGPNAHADGCACHRLVRNVLCERRMEAFE